MQIRNIQNRFEVFNANLIHSKGFWSVRMHIWSIWNRFEVFECKFKLFERISKCSNANSNPLKGIQSILIQIQTLQIRFEAFECNSKRSQRIRIQIWTREGFEEFDSNFESKLKAFERIRCIRKENRTIESHPKHLCANSNHSKAIRSIRMQILTIQKAFEAFKCKLEPFERDSKWSNEIQTIRKGFEAFECKFEPFEKNSKHSNVSSNPSKRNSNHSNSNYKQSNQIRSIWMQIQTLWTRFEAVKCKS